MLFIFAGPVIVPALPPTITGYFRTYKANAPVIKKHCAIVLEIVYLPAEQYNPLASPIQQVVLLS